MVEKEKEKNLRPRDPSCSLKVYIICSADSEEIKNLRREADLLTNDLLYLQDKLYLSTEVSILRYLKTGGIHLVPFLCMTLNIFENSFTE